MPPKEVKREPSTQADGGELFQPRQRIGSIAVRAESAVLQTGDNALAEVFRVGIEVGNDVFPYRLALRRHLKQTAKCRFANKGVAVRHVHISGTYHPNIFAGGDN